MDGESLFTPLYHWLTFLGVGREAGQQFSDVMIAGYTLWAAVHNKPLAWAARTAWLPAPLAQYAQRPSQATLSRRSRSASVLALLQCLWQHWLTAVGCALSRIKVIDAMPLRVGFASHDRTARFGYGGGGKARGYKLLARIDLATGVIEDWLVMPMNCHEAHAARDLVSRMSGGVYLLGDANFDHNHLYDLAGERGVQLVAPSKRASKGLGHHRHSPFRLRAKRLLARRIGSAWLAHRRAIERQFGTLTYRHIGLTHLPPWVRGLRRVGRWCQAKLTAHNLAQLKKQGLM